MPDIYIFAHTPYERVLHIEREQDVATVVEDLVDLVVKFWLLSQDRLQDALTCTPEIKAQAIKDMSLSVVPREEEEV